MGAKCPGGVLKCMQKLVPSRSSRQIEKFLQCTMDRLYPARLQKTLPKGTHPLKVGQAKQWQCEPGHEEGGTIMTCTASLPKSAASQHALRGLRDWCHDSPE